MADYDRKTDEWDLDRGLPQRRPSQNARNTAGSFSGKSGRTGGRPGAGYGAYDERVSNAAKRRRKKKQRIKKAILSILLTILLLILLGAAAYILMQHLPNSGSKSEAYQREIDITDAVCGDMALWLSGVDGQDIDVPWVKSRCPKLVVMSELSITKKEKGNVQYEESIEQSSYDSLNVAVYSALEGMLNEVIAESLVKAGYAETVTSQEAAGIASQVLGMGISDYIKENGVNILSSLEDLNARYTLGNGSYHISKDSININPSDSNPYSEHVIKKKDSLVLIDSGRVYIKKEGNNE